MIHLPTAEQMQALLQSRLKDCFVQVDWRTTIDSTNLQLMQALRHDINMPMPRLLGAHEQTQGRGRLGRQWISQQQQTLMFSCAFSLQAPIEQLPTVAPILGIVVCEQLRAYLKPSAQARLSMKWPNDILYDGAKLAGILVESVRSKDSGSAQWCTAIVAGIGLNINHAERLSRQLQRPIADWSQVLTDCARGGDVTETETTEATQADNLVAALAQAWFEALQVFETYGFQAFINRHHQVDALFGRAINVFNNGELLCSGTAQGLDEQARLLVATESGVQALHNGEISIRTDNEAAPAAASFPRG